MGQTSGLRQAAELGGDACRDRSKGYECDIAIMENMTNIPERPISSAFRHIVITGASSGIGAALARTYAPGRPMLSLLGRNASRLAAIAEECEAAGAAVFPEVGDVADGGFMSDWLARRDARTPIDAVIANAGVGGRFAMPQGAGETMSVAHEIFTTNLVGVANAILPVLPRFVERRRGHLVLISSLAAYIGLPDAPAYSASKAAVRIYGHGLRRVVAPHGVRVSVVCPGFVRTPMSDSIPGRLPFLWDSDQAARHIAARVARGQREIAFPWPLAMLARLAAALPPFLLDSLLINVRRNQGNS